MTSFRGVFVAVFLGTALVVAGFLIHERRPSHEIDQPSAALVRASGKCAECHRRETSAIVHEFELSRHSVANVNCLDCHQVAAGQKTLDHNGFQIATSVTAANCKPCHATEYEQYLRSRHAAPAWAAVRGPDDFTPEQVAFSERFHKGAVQRPANVLAKLEGPAAINNGCVQCHDVGKPNPDGTIGTCTAVPRPPLRLRRTGSHPGDLRPVPHGARPFADRNLSRVQAWRPLQRPEGAFPPRRPTVEAHRRADMPVPTCATCHMSGLENQKVTHDTTERLSYWLFAEVSDRRPTYQQGQINMKETCLKCHTKPRIEKFYEEAEQVVDSTNGLVREASDLMTQLREENLLTPEPFDEPIEFLYFDLWHYFGRTAKHGAFMGGADFVQWHGFYELVNKLAEIRRLAGELRQGKGEAARAAAGGG